MADETGAELPLVSSLEEAASYLRITESGLLRLVRTKKIGCLRSGRKVTFPAEVLVDYVKAHTVAALPNPWGMTDSTLKRVREGSLARGQNRRAS